MSEPNTTESSVDGLSLQDLITVAQLIQVTTQRGALRAEELAEVGLLYNKLVTFLEATGAITRNTPDTRPEGEEEMGHA